MASSLLVSGLDALPPSPWVVFKAASVWSFAKSTEPISISIIFSVLGFGGGSNLMFITENPPNKEAWNNKLITDA
jgi:hypothetical protein